MAPSWPRRWLWVLPVVALLAVSWAAVQRAGVLALEQRQRQVVVGEIYGERRVGQVFRAPYDRLFQIEVNLATYRRTNTGDVVFRLAPWPQADRELARVRIRASEIADNAFHSFTFPAIDHSAGHDFLFSIESPNSSPGDAITAWASKADVYPEGAEYDSGKLGPGDLAFVARFDAGPTAAASVILSRMAADKPSLWGSKALYLALFASYFLATGAFFYALARALWGLDGKTGGSNKKPPPAS